MAYAPTGRALHPDRWCSAAGAMFAALAWLPPAAAQYPTYPQIETTLLNSQTNYPALCQRYNLGTTVQNRTMWALRISDNVGVEEDEPEFRFISTMHGDEVTGVMLCLNLIDYLTTNYGTDPRVTNLVDSVDIWIQPCMNPDGYVLVQRENANGVDLNRNFPDPFTSPSNTTTGRQKETANIMNWAFGRSFVLAANYHGGTMVVNYPYDNNSSGSSVYTASPDDDQFIWSSEEYTRNNLPMWNSATFFHGITNGADWYAISGGMQDWSYRYMGTNEVTIEVSTVKTPPYSQMPAFWADNREAMLTYIETVLTGVRGIVTDANTLSPLFATVAVVGRDHDIFTDPAVGNYHRLLLPGTYGMTFEAAGHDTVTAGNIVVASGPATRLDLALGPPTVVSAPNGGETVFGGMPTNITWTGNPTTAFRAQYSNNYGDTTTVSDDFESGTLSGDYSTGGNQPWTVASGGAHLGTYAAKSGVITHTQMTWMTRSFTGGTLSFWYRVSSEVGYDYFNFYINGVQQVHVSGAGSWTNYTTTLPTGTTYVLRWEYTKDGSVSSGSDNVRVDDLQMTVDNTTWTEIGVTSAGATSLPWTPSVPGTNYKVRVRAEYSADAHGAWDESNATFTVQSSIPAVSDWGMVVMLLLVVVAQTLALRARYAAPRPATPVRAGLSNAGDAHA